MALDCMLNRSSYRLVFRVIWMCQNENITDRALFDMISKELFLEKQYSFSAGDGNY